MDTLLFTVYFLLELETSGKIFEGNALIIRSKPYIIGKLNIFRTLEYFRIFFKYLSTGKNLFSLEQ